MSLDLQFAYVCQKKFTELQGTSNDKRHCADCNLDVVNLDPLHEHARLELFEAAAQTGQRLCVSATVPLVNNRSCRTLPLPPRPTAGMPKMPPPEILHRERVRIEPEKQGGLLKWLQSKF